MFGGETVLRPPGIYTVAGRGLTGSTQDAVNDALLDFAVPLLLTGEGADDLKGSGKNGNSPLQHAQLLLCFGNVIRSCGCRCGSGSRGHVAML